MIEGRDFLDWLGVSGVIAGIAGAVGYGRLQGRVKTLEEKAEGVAASSAQRAELMMDIRERLVRIETILEGSK